MRYLCRLVTPPAGLVLDPFCGSGSTGKAALLEGLRFVGVDLDPAHVAIAEARCQFAVDTVAEQAAAAEAPGAQLTLF
jgi:site-specific DNA-methyltransferase (adenine-specific)